MNYINASMRRPITVVVAVIAIIIGALLSLQQMPRDILPNLNIPVIYVAQPYGGMSPAQMEGYLAYYYEYHFLYLTGIEHIESKSIQNVSLIKLQFHPGTNMSQAMAETISYADRSRAFMPPGTIPPFILRFDAGTVPVGNLVFESSTRSLGEIQDLALNRVRPLFATLPGVSAPPPFGASQRTIVIDVDPAKLRSYNLSPDDVAQAVASSNIVIPAGNIYQGKLYPMVIMNSVVNKIDELYNVPLRTGTYPTVFLKDVGKVLDSTDIPTCYALVNENRTIYIPVTKRADASTLAVVDLVRKNLGKFQSVLPDDVKVRYEFDQSIYVRRAIRSLAMEGILGALLTGLMVLLFLRDLRSALIVLINIPLSIFGAIMGLWLSGQTINIMTLGGLSLAVGILVDEVTVTIENIHTHIARGKAIDMASRDGTIETAAPNFLSLLCVLAVFIPSFFMTGALRSLFVPLSLAVGFSMIASYILSTTFVPIMSVWILGRQREGSKKHEGAFERFRKKYSIFLDFLSRRSKQSIAAYFIAVIIIFLLMFPFLGREIFPAVDAGQIKFRIRAPTGTRIEETENIVKNILGLIKKEAGDNNMGMSLGFIGVQPPNFPISTIYLWTSGPEEAVIQVLFKHNVNIKALRERLRKKITDAFPGIRLLFEPSDIVNQIMSQDSLTPIEVAAYGPDFQASRNYAAKIFEEMKQMPSLRDLQVVQSFDYPSIDINVSRWEAGVMGLTVKSAGYAALSETSSSRYVLPNYWADPSSGIAYQTQVEVPQNELLSIDDVKNIPVKVGFGAVKMQDFSKITSSTTIGEYDRYNMQRMVSIRANISGEDLGHASNRVYKMLEKLEPSKPRTVTVKARSQMIMMKRLFNGLRTGLGLSVVVILLLLAANFQSFKLSLITLSAVPAVIIGVMAMLLITGTTLNIESFMGTIMAIGIAMANAVMLVTFAERNRLAGSIGFTSSREAAVSRLRPILMTSIAMIAGMLPMSLGLGEGGEQIAPLGRAVIGGLIAATFATLTILPLIYGFFEKGPVKRISLDPDDNENK